VILNLIVDFFRNLGQQRVDAAVNAVNAKKLGAVAKAKNEAAKQFNKAVDAPTKAAKSAVQGAVGSAKSGAKAAATTKASDEPKGDSVGWFSRKKQEPEARQVETYAEPDRTVAIDLNQINRGTFKPAVGWVVVLGGELRGRDFRLVDGKNTMGTAADCDVVLTDPYLSSKHAVIRHENGVFTLVDLDSTNGTYLNERRCTKDDLIDNDKIRLGRTELKFKSLE
jgi:hypothetical protein